MDAASALAPGLLKADLSIARGLDYYTGTVYEAKMRGFEKAGTVVAGRPLRQPGRERVRTGSPAPASHRRHPHLGLLFGAGALSVSASGAGVRAGRGGRARSGGRRATRSRRRCAGAASPTEVAPAAAKYGKQIRHADRRGIPYVWFPGEPGAGEVKDIRSGDQAAADPATWEPPAEDRDPRCRARASPAAC
jgi:histidyl-tRNA synthetase